MKSLRRMARDVAREEHEERSRAESLYQRLAAMLGPWERTGTESVADIARTGLRKFGLKAPTQDDQVVEAMQSYLQGRSHSGAGMDGWRGMFGRNPRQVAAFDTLEGTDFVSRYRRGEK